LVFQSKPREVAIAEIEAIYDAAELDDRGRVVEAILESDEEAVASRWPEAVEIVRRQPKA
jgi:hypothetical protein